MPSLFLCKHLHFSVAEPKYSWYNSPMNGKSRLTIFTTPELISGLVKMGFSSTESLTILICLSELDNADCLRMSVDEISDILNSGTRSVHYALERARLYGLVKDGKRYFFGDFIDALVLTNNCKETHNGLRQVI
jgi:hypothetical protein